MLMMIALTTSVGALRLCKNISNCPKLPLNSRLKHILNQSLVNSHLEHIPCLGTLTTGCLACRDLEDLGWETDGTFYTELLGLGAVDEFGADLLEGLDVAAGESDTDLVDLWAFAKVLRSQVSISFC